MDYVSRVSAERLRSRGAANALAREDGPPLALRKLQQEALQKVHGLGRPQLVVPRAPELGVLLHLREAARHRAVSVRVGAPPRALALRRALWRRALQSRSYASRVPTAGSLYSLATYALACRQS
jgi:hypothetical protein